MLGGRRDFALAFPPPTVPTADEEPARRRVALHGCYNTLNFGDVLLLDLLARHVAARPDTRAFNPWPPAAKTAKTGERGLLGCLRADAAVFGGGGYLTDAGGRSTRRLSRYSLPARLWRTTRTPYCIVGAGIGPPLTGRGARHAATVFRGARYAAVRDDASRALLAERGIDVRNVEVTADLALSLRRDDIDQSNHAAAATRLGTAPPGVRRLGVHLAVAGLTAQLVNAIAAALAKGLAGDADGVEVVWLFDHGDADAPVVADISRRHLPRFRVLGRQPVWPTIALLSALDGVITTKLHVGIVAWAVGTPPCGFSAHGKTRRFYEQVGRTDHHAPFDPSRLDALQRWTRQFAMDPAAFAAEDAIARRHLPGRARRNLDLVDALLDETR